jgi:sigma-E factor negative regulatory protein RseA
MMKQEISALMDGELFEDEADSLIDRIKRDPAAHQDWAIYHLIGDVLRQPESIHRDIGAAVREQLQNEPTVLAPRRQLLKQKVRSYALSAVASVLAFAVVAWMSLQISPNGVAQPSMRLAQNQGSIANGQIRDKFNDYLMAHQDVSPDTSINSGASYLRAVSYEEKSQ